MDRALIYLHKSEPIFRNSDYHLEAANLFIRIAVIYSIINQPGKALKFAMDAEKLASKAKSSEALFRSKVTLGLIHKQLANYITALEYYFQASQISEAMVDVSNQLMLSTNIGNVYFDLEDLSKAKYYYNQTLRIAIDNKNIYSLSQALGNLAVVYIQKKDKEKAMFYLDTCIAIRESLGDYYALNAILANKAFFLLDLGSEQDAFNLFMQIIQDVERCRKVTLVNSYFGLAKIENMRGNHLSALNYLRKAQQLNLGEGNLIEQKTILEGIEKTYYLLGNYKKAYEYLLQLYELSEKIFNLETAKQSGFHEAKHHFLQKEKQLMLEQYQKDKEAQNTLQYQKNLKLILFAVIVIILIISVLIYLNLSDKKKKNKELKKQKEDIESQKVKLEEVNEIKNKLFSIIAHDLKSPLVTFKGMLDLVQAGVLTEKEFNSFIPELSENVECTTNMLNNLLSWTKSQMKGVEIIKSEFDIHSIIVNLISLYSKNINEKSLTVINEINSGTIIYTDKNILEFVLRNLIYNAIKFNHPNGIIKIYSVGIGSEQIKICVEDTGVGIPEKNLRQILEGNSITTAGTSNEKGNGLGLMLCKDFIESINGNLSITSKPNEGSCFCFTLKKVRD